MSLWVQHGHGKGSKIRDLGESGLVDGAILSPADEQPETLAATVRDLSEIGLTVLVDPQMYVYSIPDGTTRFHRDHGIEVGQLRWDPSPNDIRDHTSRIVRLSRDLGASAVVSPAALQGSFNDVWTPITLQYARETQAQWTGDLYVSAVIDQAAFGDWDAIEAWLDTVTRLDVSGFYLVACRDESPYPQAWDPVLMANLLRVIYRLSELNQYRVIWGYADIAGLLGTAAGAAAICSGWYYSLRQFTRGKWIPREGGRQPTPRVLLPGLMVPILAEPEGRAVADSGLSADAFLDRELRDAIGSGERWGIGDSWVQHLRALSRLVNEVEDSGSTALTRAEYTLSRIRTATLLLSDLERDGVVMRRDYAATLQGLRLALERFLEAENPR